MKQKFRVQSLKNITGAIAEHMLGERRPPNAKPREGLEFVEHLGSDGEPIDRMSAGKMLFAANELLREEREKRRKEKRGGYRASGIIDFFAGGPTWKDEKNLRGEFAATFVKWIRDKLGPRSKIAIAAIHNDETAFHVHVVAVCVSPEGRFGWSHVASTIGEADYKGSQRLFLSGLQDAFHRNVGSKFGIERGAKLDGTKFAPVDRVIGAWQRGVQDERDRLEPLIEKLAEDKIEEGVKIGLDEGRREGRKLARQKHEEGFQSGKKAFEKVVKQAMAEVGEQKFAEGLKQGRLESEEEARLERFAAGIEQGKAERDADVDAAFSAGEAAGAAKQLAADTTNIERRFERRESNLVRKFEEREAEFARKSEEEKAEIRKENSDLRAALAATRAQPPAPAMPVSPAKSTPRAPAAPPRAQPKPVPEERVAAVRTSSRVPGMRAAARQAQPLARPPARPSAPLGPAPSPAPERPPGPGSRSANEPTRPVRGGGKGGGER